MCNLQVKYMRGIYLHIKKYLFYADTSINIYFEQLFTFVPDDQSFIYL